MTAGSVPSYALAGDGRLATSLKPYLEHHGARVTQWSRAREATGKCPPIDTVVGSADTVLLAISDDALPGFLDQSGPAFGDRTIVQFSGALSLPGIAGLHPLASFPPHPMKMDALSRVTFTSEVGGPGMAEIFPMLPNPSFAIPADAKPLYHALAVLTGNLSSLVWNLCAEVARDRLGADPAALYAPYFASIVDGFAASPHDSLTGPAARGDVETLRRNLAALEHDPALSDLYRTFLRVARSSGKPVPSGLGEAP